MVGDNSYLCRGNDDFFDDLFFSRGVSDESVVAYGLTVLVCMPLDEFYILVGRGGIECFGCR